MFSRILYNHQSPKKSREADIIDLSTTNIIQTSSDEECSQILFSPKKKKLKRLHSTQSPPIKSQQSDYSLQIKGKPLLKRVVNSVRDSDKGDEQYTNTNELKGSKSDSSSEDDYTTDSSGSLFDKESDFSQDLETVNKMKLKSVLVNDSIIEEVLPICKPSKPQIISPSVSSKKWKKSTTSNHLPSFPHTSPQKVHSLPPSIKSNRTTKYDFDIYDYTPPLSSIAIGDPSKQSFSEWYFYNHSSTFCILLGPPGSGKRSFLKSFCSEHQIEIVSWNSESAQNSNKLLSRSVASFIHFIQTTKRYIPKSFSMTDSIQSYCKQLVVIDVLPVTLHESFLHDMRFQQDRLYFQKMIEELAYQPRREDSRLYVWVVDTVNEMRGLVSLRPLIPSILSLPITKICLNPPGIRLCTKALKSLYGDLPAALIRKICETSHGDLRQCCLKCWIYGKEIFNPQKTTLLLNQSEEDSFWGLFHMIKKLLLAKRLPDGTLENDFDSLFVNNVISLHETTSYLYANLPDYSGDITDLADMYDVLCDNEVMGSAGHRSSSHSLQSFDEKGNESFQSLLDRLRFFLLGLSVPVYNHHPTSIGKSFSEIKPSMASALSSQIYSHRNSLVGVFRRYNEVYSTSLTFGKFIIDYASVIHNLHKDLLGTIQQRRPTHELLDIQEFVNVVSLMMDVDDISLFNEVDLDDDPILD